ncbi:hypothetical protein CBL_02997 [Carabus blaptoides fortunei]
MEDGTRDQHRGKILQQIDITDRNSQTLIFLIDQEFYVTDSLELQKPHNEVYQTNMTILAENKQAPVSPMGKIKRRTWSIPEKNAARKNFKTYIEDQYLPSGLLLFWNYKN